MIQTLADALAARGYETLTPVQQAVTNPDLVGQDMLVSAQTGSGKTVGFGLAIAPTLLEGEKFGPAASPLALIIAPTRELAMQVKRELDWLYAGAGVVMASCVGGMDMRDERRALDRGAHIVVATPGRLRDHIMRNSLDMSDIRAVVLDEADEMLDLGFREDLEYILGEAPEGRQTLMFSATVPAAIAKLAKSYQKNAVRVETKADTSQHADIEYRAMDVSARDGENAIINILRFYESPNAIVFCNTRAMVNRITTRLSNRGFSVVALSGELTQGERTNALQAMRDGRARVCVATDVAARGIDLPNLDLVIHAELPNNHETLLHRSGRTGRAGRKGTSTLIVPPKFRRKAERLLSMAKLNAGWGPAPSAEAILAQDEERMLADDSWSDAIHKNERDTVAKLTATYSAEQIAAAYLRLFKANRSAPEDLADLDAKPAPKAAFGPSVWFSITGGSAAGQEPRRLLPMLCKAGDMDREDIGAIRIGADESYVEIRASALDGFTAAMGPDMVLEQGAKLTKLAKPPAMASKPRPAYQGNRDWNEGPHDKGPRDKKPFDKKPFDKKPYDKKPKDGFDKKPYQSRDAAPMPKDDPRSDAPKPQYDAPKPRKPHADKPAAGTADTYAKPAPAKDRKKSHDDKGWAKRDGKLKGPPPPVGRADSKKNKARAAAGGEQPPRRGDDKPNGKSFGKPAGKSFGKPGGKPAGKSFGKPGGKPGGKPAGKPRANASDTSKRFTPPKKG